MKKFLLVLFFLISLVPQVFAIDYFSHEYDFEADTAGNAPSGFNSQVTANVTANNDRSASFSGIMESKFHYIAGTEGHLETRVENYNGTSYAVSDGDVIYMKFQMYWDSGTDFGDLNTGATGNEKKIMRLGFRKPNGTWGKYISIMMLRDNTTSPRFYFSNEAQGFSLWKYSQTPFADMSAATVQDVELSFQIADDATGFVSMTVEGVNQVETNIQTIPASYLGGYYENEIFGSTHNGLVRSDHDLYVNDMGWYLNIYPGGTEPSPGNDITDPTWTSLTPANGSTGFDIDATDIVGVVQDSGDGVDSATIKVHSDQITIDQSLLTISGTSAQYTVTYDNDYFTNDLTWDDNLTVSFGATDLNANVAATVSTSFTVQSEPVVGTTFGSGAINTITNWDFKRDQAGQTSLPDRWEVFTLNGEDVLYINDSSFVSDGEGLGEYAVYQDFEAKEVELIFEARSAESIAGNSYADICGVIGWINDRTYCYVMFNAATGTDSNGTHNYTQGEVDSQYTNLVNVKQDVWQKYKIVYQDETITVYRKYPNDEWVMTFTRGNIKLNKGKVGLGSYNDSVYFRNVSVKSLDDEVQLAQGVEYVGAKIT